MEGNRTRGLKARGRAVSCAFAVALAVALSGVNAGLAFGAAATAPGGPAAPAKEVLQRTRLTERAAATAKTEEEREREKAQRERTREKRLVCRARVGSEREAFFARQAARRSHFLATQKARRMAFVASFNSLSHSERGRAHAMLSRHDARFKAMQQLRRERFDQRTDKAYGRCAAISSDADAAMAIAAATIYLGTTDEGEEFGGEEVLSEEA